MADNPFDFQNASDEPVIRLPRQRRRLRGPSQLQLALPLWGIFLLLAGAAVWFVVWRIQVHHKNEVDREIWRMHDEYRLKALQDDGIDIGPDIPGMPPRP